MSFANAAMLLGLLGVAIPVLIHLLSRRRVPTIAWGAMQFLELGRKARARLRLDDWLLLACRMLLLALVALAASRPIWSSGVGPGLGGAGPRDLVLVVDASAGMARRGGGTSSMAEARRIAGEFLGRLARGDAVAVVRAGTRAKPISGPLSVDPAPARAALDDLAAPSGSADLPSALAEAFRILDEQGRNPAAEVVVLTDGSRAPWRPDDRGRWRLLRDLHGQLPSPPRIAAVSTPVEPDPGSADGSVVDLRASRRLVAPGGTIVVGATVRNRGPASLERSAQLRIDGEGVPGSTRAVGPVPPGGSAPVEFRATLDDLGAHAVTVRLAPDGGTPDPLPTDDEESLVVEVAEALPVLLVDGEPGLEPMTGEVDFLRAALAPRGEQAPQVQTSVIPPDALDGESLEQPRVLVLANVDRLTPAQQDAVLGLLDRGGGVLVLPGDRTDVDSWNRDAFRDARGWLPARIGPLRGRFLDREPVARPSPPSFEGPALGPLGSGESPPLGSASLFASFLLEPAGGDDPAGVSARLDSGEPWLVDRKAPGSPGSGRVALLAGPLDAEGGTLPANPDFVPFVRELVFLLADPGDGGPGSDASIARPGEPIAVPIDPAPEALGSAVPVRTPSGRVVSAAVEREGDAALARLAEADEPGLYRFDLPGGPRYRRVATPDGPPPDPSPLSPDEADALAEGWPLSFSTDVEADPLPSSAPPGRSRRPLWRGLLLAALAGLCLEVWLTRRLALRRGIPAAEARGGDE
ncbi:BatA domain-containing protein [Tautonia plasticadhaerens]|uniref:VWFA domain-containing protein n=1 Tax=Tautonia plasticadhaerens TaxID=2527974 RepID=A0A518HDF8_9BACT|nr:BatA domain-containing protein [Tautonia plasticadhaerens]QDV38889.1 hypothetical protein ElP_68490 [Tautonia plasticadhaerens]